ncbi:MAG: DUF2569 family protein [Methylobacterium sp.]|jgi:hypothetical protein|nr:DUF2569 family protein [Methylobacterium sp.]
MGSASIWHWIVVLLAVGLPFAAIIFFAKRAKARQPNELSGIGGWLVLPIIGFIGTIALTTFNFLQIISEFDGVKAFFSTNSGPINQLKIPIATSILLGLAVIISASVCLYCIFQTKSGVARIATWHYILLACAGIADFWADSVLRTTFPNTPSDPNVLRDAIRGFLIAAIWIPYFWLSKRVKNTFERPTSADASASEKPLAREISQ